MAANPLRIKEIAFSGRLRTAPDPSTIGPNDYQECVNIRPTENGLVGVGGDSKINSTSIGQDISSGIHYRKDRPAESHVIVDGADNKPYANTTAIPSAGNFGAAALYATAGTQSGRYAVAPGGLLARCTGNKSLLYGGTKFPCRAFIDNPATDKVWDYSEQVANTLTTSDQIATIHASSNVATFYIGSLLPIAGFYLDMNTVNTVASTMAVYFWGGTEWTSVGDLSDGTSSASISLRQDGWATFDDTQASAKQSVIEKQLAFWYKVTVSGSSDFSGVPKINTVYLKIPMQPIQDLWDGEMLVCPAFLRWNSSSSTYYTDQTMQVYDKYYDTTNGDFTNKDTLSCLNSDYLAATGHVLIGSPVPLTGIEVSMVSEEGKGVNTGNSVIDLFNYWDGDSWVDITSTITDGTLDSTGAKSLNKTGWITWPASASNTEKPSTSLPGHKTITSSITGKEETLTNSTPLYYYKISWSAVLSTYTFVYAIRLIPAPKQILGCSFPVRHAGRLFLCDFLSEDRNAVRYSALDTANTFNGKDSDKVWFGGDEALVAGVSIYNRFGSTESNLLVLAKRGETWCLSGEMPEKWVKYCASDAIGCIAPATMCAVNLPSKEVTPGVSSNAAIWLTQKGVVLFSGASFTYISDDIADLFDENKGLYLGAAILPTCAAFVDSKRNEYHLIVPGSQEWVYNYQLGKWFKVNRGTGNYLCGGIPVQDTSGVSYVYGFDASGYLRRLEYGTTFNGSTDQTFSLKTACLALHNNMVGMETWHRGFKLVQKAKNTTSNDVALTHYGDTATTGTSLATVDPAATGKRLSDVSQMDRIGPHTFHEYRMEFTSDNETGGFEPLFLAIFYEPARADILE